MSIEEIKLIELALVCCVLVIQLIVFLRTWLRIARFRGIIPMTSMLRVEGVAVPGHELQSMSAHELIVKYAAINRGVSDHLGGGILPKEVVNMLQVDTRPGKLFEQIRYSINNYLIRNRGAATDFNLVKDIVERNTGTIEEDINLSVAVPLYLGLMGTMMGIVIGLFSMPDIGALISSGTNADGSQLDQGINMLISGVRIAMIASFTGLLMTVVNSGWRFRAARRHVEAQKNNLYTLIQVELLPVINQGMASTLDSLQRNLMRFNEEFKVNLGRLGTLFDSNAEAIRIQKELLDTIAEAQISEMAKYNVKVLNKLEKSTGHLEKFNDYLANVNLLVGGTQQIVIGVNSFLARTEDVKRVADTIGERLHESGHLMEFLTGHFKKLEEYKDITAKAVIDVGHSMSGVFDELKGQIGESTNAVKKFTVDELEVLKTALSESRTNLSNLGHLEALAKDVAYMKASTASQLDQLKGELSSTVKTLGEMSNGLKAVNAHLSNKSVVASVKNSLGKFWGRGRNGSARKK